MSRRTFEPTLEQRNSVELAIGFGLTEAEVCQLIKNPETNEPIDEKTLRKHFAPEIAAGHPKVKVQVGNRIVATILGRDGGLKSDHAAAALMTFYARTRMGWKETIVNENVGKDGGPIVIHISEDDANL